MQRVELCKEDRLTGAEDRRKLAATPFVFRETKNPDTAIVVPRHSSENRLYIPLGFIGKEMIFKPMQLCVFRMQEYMISACSNQMFIWHGQGQSVDVLKAIIGISKDIVYNNCPWPTPTDAQKARIEQTAQGILDARALYPDCSLADLYDEVAMPPELRKAHQQNDRAVMDAYGFVVGTPERTSESECVAALMRRYQKLTSKSINEMR